MKSKTHPRKTTYEKLDKFYSKLEEQREQLTDLKCPPNERCKTICDECAVVNGLKQG